MIYRQNTLKNIIIHICNILCGEIYFLDLKVISKIHSRLTTLVHYTLSHKELQLPVIMYLASRGVCVHIKPRERNPFLNQLAEVVQCLMGLHLTITKQNYSVGRG